MNPIIKIDQLVDVVAVFHPESTKGQKCQPYKMRFNGREIIFQKLAFRHPTTKGARMLHVMDVSDGSNDYRLEFDAESLQWRLISMIELGAL